MCILLRLHGATRYFTVASRAIEIPFDPASIRASRGCDSVSAIPRIRGEAGRPPEKHEIAVKARARGKIVPARRESLALFKLWPVVFSSSSNLFIQKYARVLSVPFRPQECAIAFHKAGIFAVRATLSPIDSRRSRPPKQSPAYLAGRHGSGDFSREFLHQNRKTCNETTPPRWERFEKNARREQIPRADFTGILACSAQRSPSARDIHQDSGSSRTKRKI